MLIYFPHFCISLVISLVLLVTLVGYIGIVVIIILTAASDLASLARWLEKKKKNPKRSPDLFSQSFRGFSRGYLVCCQQQ